VFTQEKRKTCNILVAGCFFGALAAAGGAIVSNRRCGCLPILLGTIV